MTIKNPTTAEQVGMDCTEIKARLGTLEEKVGGIAESLQDLIKVIRTQPTTGAVRTKPERNQS